MVHGLRCVARRMVLRGSLVPLVLAGILLAPPLTARPPARLGAGAVPEPPPGRHPPSVSEEDEDALSAAAAGMRVVVGKRELSGKALESKITPSMLRALNEWADVIAALDFAVVVAPEGNGFVAGPVERDALLEAAEAMGGAWQLLAPLRVTAEGGDAEARSGRRRSSKRGQAPVVVDGDGATVGFLFDRADFDSEAWPGLMNALVSKGLLSARTADAIAREKAGVTLRDALLFIQPTEDLAGDAAAGDDEFRLPNEMANKTTQCLLTARFGQLPETLRWGMGFVAEQRLYHAIYQFNAAGFVAAVDHFDWPEKTRELLKQREKSDDDFVLSAFIDERMAAGRPEAPQMAAWGVLEYMLAEHPAELGGMLTELAALHADAVGGRSRPDYSGAEEPTREVLARHVDALDFKAMLRHIKKAK